MTPEDKSKIEELKKSLYSRNAPEVRHKRRFHFGRSEANEVKTDFDHPQENPTEVVMNDHYENHSMSFFTKLLIGSIIFFVIAVSSGAYLILNGSNIISANNIDIVINGPVTIAGGDPLSFNVQVNNKNNIKLQAVDLDITFPPGTVDPTDRSKELKESRELMDDIVPGGISQKTVQAIMYGEENTKRDITVNVSYHVAGSNAVFQKQKTYEVLISSSPLSLSVSSVKEVTSGQEFDFKLAITSNSKEIIRNLLLKASYPFGFTFISSGIKPEDNGGTTWKIGDIPPGGKKTITLRGRLEGQDNELRDFKFSLGAQSTTKSDIIATEYVAALQEISIQKPFITATVNFDGDTNNQDYIATFNHPVQVTVNWFNNLPTAILDGEIHVKLSGNSFDKVSVDPGDGYYKSSENEIVWNKITMPSLGNIEAGGNGSIRFSVTPRDFSTPLKLVSNPSFSVDVGVNGNRTSESNVPQNVVSSAKRSARISSQLSLTSAITRTTGPFTNTGTIPPHAEKETTYTVLWTVNNTSSSVTGAEVRALLPAYVKKIGKISPVGEDISYDSTSGQVVWRVGNVDTYTQNTSHTRQVAFQISFTPSITQVGQVPILVQDTTLTGRDDFTGVTLTSTERALTTNFSTDPSFKEGNAVVAP